MAKPTRPENIPLFDVPAELLSVVDEVARRHLGKDDARGDALAAQVRTLSKLYTRDRHGIGGDDRGRLAAARLRFFLPRDVAKVMYPLAELEAAGVLPTGPRLSVLDLGAGLGATSLGAARFVRVREAARGLDVFAIDPFQRGLTILEALAERAEAAGLCPVSVQASARTMDERLPSGPFDLILVGLALNEWARDRRPEDAAALLSRIAKRLAPGGALIVLEPALRAQARFLQQTRDALAAKRGGLTVFAPCTHLEACPMLPKERDWCHTELVGDLPPDLSKVARAAGLRRSRRTFSYLTLRHQEPDVEDRPFRVVSQLLPSKGKRELFVCGHGDLVRLTRLDRHESEENEAFDRAGRGDLMHLPKAMTIERGTARIRAEDVVRLQGIGRATEPPN